MRGFRVLRNFVLCVVLAALLGSCAEERLPINRVQPNALAKVFFVGQLDDPNDDPEFFMRTTVVDVAAGAGSDGLFTSSDAQPIVRIRWEITEELLIARLSYELIDGTDGKGASRTADGQIVAAYAIESHFDIRRDYNETTGEETNVIVENDVDRPWSKRDYMRVDWSRNLVTDAYDLDTLSQLGIYYGVEWSPVAYYVSDADHPDAPQFDVDRGYFDVTHKAFAAPQVIEDPDYGDFPVCWLIGYWPQISCNPSEVTLRQAYLRVTDTDYEPLLYDGTQMEMFGVFTTDRFGYDRRYGIVDDQWRRFAARWNLYQQSHADPPVLCNTPDSTAVGDDPHRDNDEDGTEDECASVGRGSRCDAVVGECTIPLRDRPVRTIPWHVNADFPIELWEGTAAALEVWNRSIRVAIMAGRLAECRRTGEADCESQLGWPTPWRDEYAPPVGSDTAAEVPNIFVLCHNPVDPELDDTAICGDAGLSPRLGDLRFNFLNILPNPQAMAPWGIMMDANDPLSGETIAASVNQWSHVLDRAASNLVDILGLLNGQIAPTDFIQGQDVSDWIAANQLAQKGENAAPMSSAELQSHKRSFDPKVLEPYRAGMPPVKPGVHPYIKHKGTAQALTDSGRLGPGNGVLANRLTALRGTQIEAAMVTPEMAQAAGFDPTSAISKEAIRRGSPFGRMNPTFRREETRTRRMALVERHSCRMDAPEPDHLLGLAREAQQRFPPPDPSDKSAVNAHRDEVFQWARQAVSAGVMAHELGHSMGLRHNFAASFDSLNYDAQYWQLRTNHGEATDDCAEGTQDGSDCVAPRYRDPISQYEVDNNIGKYATTSVMDYPGDSNHDFRIDGKYDRAAMRFIYGGTVDVWDKDGVNVEASGAAQDEAYRLVAFTLNPGLFGTYYFTLPDPNADYEFIHYSQYQNQFGLISNCRASDEDGGVDGIKCDQLPMDVADYRDMQDFALEPDYADFVWAQNPKAVTKDGRVRRGYQFSSDEYADSGNVPAFSYDAGADAYEQIRFMESAYENRYIFDSFRRNQVMFNSWDATARIQYRYLDNMQLIAKTFAFGAILDGDPTQPADAILQDGFYGPLAIGTSISLDLFTKMVTRAEPGYYCEAPFCGVAPTVGIETPVFVADFAALPEVYLYDFRVGLGDGRYLHNDYDYSQGYFWGDYQSQVGTFYEKIWATYYLAEAFDYFISSAKEDYIDSRYKNVNYATIYPEQVRRLYANLFTNDLEIYAPWVTPAPSDDDTPLAALTYPEWRNPTGLGTRPADAYLADPNHGWNAQLYAMVWGTIYFPSNWSTQWIHDARIAVLGGEQPSWPEAETYRFYFPESGLTYSAHTNGTEVLLGKVVERSVGARMLQWANHLMTYAYLVERDIDGIPILNPDGTPTLVVDVDGKAQLDPANPGADAVLRQYVDTIDLMRQLSTTFQQPLDDELPGP